MHLDEREAKRYFERLDALVEFSRLFDYGETNDRAIAIVGPAFLDSLLSDILVEFMVDDAKQVELMLNNDGGLASYGSRARACYCLGLIPEIVFEDLRLVGKIRNRFAHDLRATFDDSQISSWCRTLKWHKVLLPVPGDARNRDLFQVGINQLVSYLNGIPGLARANKRTKRTF